MRLLKGSLLGVLFGVPRMLLDFGRGCREEGREGRDCAKDECVGHRRRITVLACLTLVTRL